MTKTLKIKVGAFTCIPGQGMKILAIKEAEVGKTNLKLDELQREEMNSGNNMNLKKQVNEPGENIMPTNNDISKDDIRIIEEDDINIEAKDDLPGENDLII